MAFQQPQRININIFENYSYNHFTINHKIIITMMNSTHTLNKHHVTGTALKKIPEIEI